MVGVELGFVVGDLVRNDMVGGRKFTVGGSVQITIGVSVGSSVGSLIKSSIGYRTLS